MDEPEKQVQEVAPEGKWLVFLLATGLIGLCFGLTHWSWPVFPTLFAIAFFLLGKQKTKVWMEKKMSDEEEQRIFGMKKLEFGADFEEFDVSIGFSKHEKPPKSEQERRNALVEEEDYLVLKRNYYELNQKYSELLDEIDYLKQQLGNLSYDDEPLVSEEDDYDGE